MSNLRTVANRPWARLEGFFPPKRVEFAFGQLRPARWESWPSLSHAIVSVLQVLYGRGLLRRLKVAAQQPSSGLAGVSAVLSMSAALFAGAMAFKKRWKRNYGTVRG